MPPSRVSHAVVRGGSRRIPRPRLGENTLQLADELVVTQAPDGTWFVAVRCVFGGVECGGWISLGICVLGVLRVCSRGSKVSGQGLGLGLFLQLAGAGDPWRRRWFDCGRCVLVVAACLVDRHRLQSSHSCVYWCVCCFLLQGG